MVKEWSAREARKERSDYSIKVYGSLEGKSFRAEKRRIWKGTYGTINSHAAVDGMPVEDWIEATRRLNWFT
jgi:hypothetical protein